MRKTVNKLVRDRVPELIRQDGRRCETEVMPAPDYRTALLAKLLEEAAEVASSDPDKVASELCDVLDVVDAIALEYGINSACLRAERERRLHARGGFDRRIKLIWFETPNGAD